MNKKLPDGANTVLTLLNSLLAAGGISLAALAKSDTGDVKDDAAEREKNFRIEQATQNKANTDQMLLWNKGLGDRVSSLELSRAEEAGYKRGLKDGRLQRHDSIVE